MDFQATATPPLVLIVEDDAAVRLALATTAELEGFQVLACDCAESALHLNLPATHACLVVDEQLPGMSGLRLLGRMRTRGCGLPAVLITTNPTQRQRAAASEAGAQVLEKPLLGDALMAWIRRAVAT